MTTPDALPTATDPNSPSTETVAIVTRNLRKAFETAEGTLSILEDVNLTLHRGEAVAITGPSGSGKSTLLYILGGLDEPTGGDLEVLGQNPCTGSAGERAAFRNQHIGFIFQDHHLLPQCTVLENVTLPALAAKQPQPDTEDRAKALLERVGLKDRMGHRPARISGGERQRVAVCRALLNNPEVVLADEPTGNLDQARAGEIGSLLLELCDEQNALLVCVTHSLELANRFPIRRELERGTLVDPAASGS